MSITKSSIIHGIVSAALFAVPMFLASGSPYLDLTVGGLLNALYHFLMGYNAEA